MGLPLHWECKDSTTQGRGISKSASGGVIRTPHPRLGRRKFAASLGPLQARRNPGVRQEARRPRQRRCLLKGCERPFRPTHPQARYCSPECRAAARRWRQRRSSRQYRKTANGQEKRREQSRRNPCLLLRPPPLRGPSQGSPALQTDVPCEDTPHGVRGSAPSRAITIFSVAIARGAKSTSCAVEAESLSTVL